MKKEVLVGLDHFFEIFFVDRLLSRRILFLQTLFQNLGTGLQIDHQIGRGELFAKIVVIAIVGFEFLIGEVEAGEELIFFENKIGNDGFLGAWPKIERAELFEAANQESELRLESRAAFAVVKGAQKGVVFGFHHPLGVEALSQNPCQRALSDAYGAFHSNVAGQFEKIGHGIELRMAGYPDKALRAIEGRVTPVHHRVTEKQFTIATLWVASLSELVSL